MKNRTLALLVALSVVSLRLPAHTISLGEERAPRACAVIRESRAINALFYQHQKQELSYVDGVRLVSVVVLPTRPRPNNQPDALLNDCAKGIYHSASSQQVRENSMPEENFIRGLNQCLQSRRAGYEVSGAFFQRSDVSCPEATRPASSQQ